MKVQEIVTPGGETLVVLPKAEFLRLVEAAEDREDVDAARSYRRALAAGAEEAVPLEAAKRLVAGEHPVRVFRELRGLSISALAEEAGLSQPYVSQIESGQRTGSAASLAKLARVLGVSLDELA